MPGRFRCGVWFLPIVTSWTLSNHLSRREAVAGIAAALPLPAFAAVKAPSRNPAVLREQLVLILRVQEATGQETRLIKTGKYKVCNAAYAAYAASAEAPPLSHPVRILQELQRLNIKRAISFMLDNYSLRDRFVTASAFAPLVSTCVKV